jgi:uncharacterized protein YeaO (DUF488 family)
MPWTSPLCVYTAPLAYRGPDRLDVSPLTGDPLGQAFAPPAALVTGFQRRQAKVSPGMEGPWVSFVSAYTQQMRGSLRASRQEQNGAWRVLLARPSVTLVCFCADPATCHRSVLAGLLARCGAREGGEREVSTRARRIGPARGVCLLPDARKVLGR